VLSDKAKDPSARSYSLSPSIDTTVRTTRPLGKRAAEYQGLIEEHAALNTVNVDLVRALIRPNRPSIPRQVSPKGALGLMQLMPATATEFGVTDAFDPTQNIRAGVKYLKQLLDTYEGRVELALAAYNAGPGRGEEVRRQGPALPRDAELRRAYPGFDGSRIDRHDGLAGVATAHLQDGADRRWP
jgi:soluble lytic murein transglycosylase-like protein